MGIPHLGKKERISVFLKQIARPDVAYCPGVGAGGLPGAGKPASGGETDFWLVVRATVSVGGLRHEAWNGLCSVAVRAERF